MAMIFDTCHPVYYRLHQLGKNIDRGDILNTFYTYMELCEVKRYWNVNYHCNEEINLLYVSASKTKNSDPDVFITFPSFRDISLEDIELLQNKLKIESLILVFKEGHSSSVYYKVTNHLVKPSSPEDSKKLKQKEEKKYELEKEIKRHKTNLFEMAKSLINKNESDDNCIDSKKLTNELENVNETLN